MGGGGGGYSSLIQCLTLFFSPPYFQPAASDWTMYPFSSQNEKDFRNLLSVYLDCVFSPQLREIDFKQEAWRLEYEDPSNRSSPIVFKGVVYNEMKGHFVRQLKRRTMTKHAVVSLCVL